MNRCFLLCAFATLTLGADETPKGNIAVATQGTPQVDGEIEAAWKEVPKVAAKIRFPICLPLNERR